MRTLVVTENITLDGVIDLAGGWFDPQRAVDPSAAGEMAALERRHRDAADAVLLGRRTFEEFAGYWPRQADDTTGVTDYLNRTRKYVVSATLADPQWQPTTVLRGDLADEVRTLKEADGGDIVATGSISLVRALVRTGLVDEYRLFVYPVVVGRGARLFEDLTGAPPLRLAEARQFGGGVAYLRYTVAR